MSGASEASSPSATVCVPGGPMTRSGEGAKVVTQRLVITSLKSVM